ncbi:hypothetical protein PtrEW4_011645 [Pyrenophora tritici-repentis]|nr:hypothetical protein PtrSN001A_011607 [Pyrenophora tritici-repentis]KAI1559624.1 hypothetical protein PtrEW4_011645 [Pyrenophora tritici-repentis]PWO19875.1 hypothetical protein PtrARCrB10_11621 [Pyrenophora tritici-repentis]PZC88334.1 hypothetical protein A1F95_10981 [Pyrenophora tritici-repentis]
MPLKKRVLNALVTPNKRAKVAPRSTASQPIIIETQSSLSRLSPRKALVEASRATNFESQLRESQAKDAIVAPAEGSEEATAALSKAADEATDKGFDAHLKDSFENINWSRLPHVLRYVVRLYDYLKPRVVEELSQAISKIHLSFDGWTTKGGKRGFLGVVAHYVDHQGNLKDLPIALPQLTGAHSGEKMAEVVSKTLQEFNISPLTVSYFVLNNASNNNSAVLTIAQKIGFNAVYRRLRCGPHTINLIGQFMREWRRDGPLGVLLSIINYIKTPQQYALFANFQRLAHRELPIDAPAEERKILEPVKPVVTRQNSYYLCFERAVKLQSAVNAYANHYIKRVRDEDTYAQSRDALKPLKAATKRLEGRGKSGGFGAIAEIILVFEYLLGYYEQRVKAYEAVDYNAHNEAPKDHLAINLRAA